MATCPRWLLATTVPCPARTFLPCCFAFTWQNDGGDRPTHSFNCLFIYLLLTILPRKRIRITKRSSSFLWPFVPFCGNFQLLLIQTIIAKVRFIFHFLPCDFDMFFEVLIVGIGEIASEVDASTLLPHLGRLRHKEASGEHVLAFPAFG